MTAPLTPEEGILEYDEDMRALIWTERESPDEYGASTVEAWNVRPKFAARLLATLAAARAHDYRSPEFIQNLAEAIHEHYEHTDSGPRPHNHPVSPTHLESAAAIQRALVEGEET